MVRRTIKILTLYFGIPLVPYYLSVLLAKIWPWWINRFNAKDSIRDVGHTPNDHLTAIEYVNAKTIIGQWLLGIPSLLIIVILVFLILLISNCTKNYVTKGEYTCTWGTT